MGGLGETPGHEGPDERPIARRDRHQQPGEVLGVSHKARYLAGMPGLERTARAVAAGRFGCRWLPAD